MPGVVHFGSSIAPSSLKNNHLNFSTPATTADFLPTIMDLLQVESDNPTWPIDGINLLPLVSAGNTSAARDSPIGIWWGNQQGIIDDAWKLITKPEVGQCDEQPGFDFGSKDKYFLYNLEQDYNELHDLKTVEPDMLQRLVGLLAEFNTSVVNSQVTETKCAKSIGPLGPVTPSSDCTFSNNTGLNGGDIYSVKVTSQEECCGVCRNTPGCAASDFTGGSVCHLKEENSPKLRNDGSVASVPL